MGGHAKKPFDGPQHVLHYLARYAHRLALSNHRLIAMEDGTITFRWKDYSQGAKKQDNSASRGGHPALPAARAAEGFHAHPPLWEIEPLNGRIAFRQS